MPKASLTVCMSNIGVLDFNQCLCCQINKKILQRYDIFTSCLMNFDTETLSTAFVGQ